MNIGPKCKQSQEFPVGHGQGQVSNVAIGYSSGGVGGGALTSASQYNTRTQRSLDDVLSWISYVLAKLHDVQWKTLGYEMSEGQEPDFQKPVFGIHNPNPIVEDVLTR